MKLPSVYDYLDAIEELGWLDEILYEVVLLIPNRYFYQPYIQQSYYQAMREEIGYQITKLKSSAYQSDRTVRARLNRLVSTYQEELRYLALELKNDLLLYLLHTDNASKYAYLAEAITKYRLLPYLVGDLRGM